MQLLNNFLRTAAITIIDLHSTLVKDQAQEHNNHIRIPQVVLNQGIQAAQAHIQLQLVLSLLLFKRVPHIIHHKIHHLISRRQQPYIIRHKSLRLQRKEWDLLLRTKYSVQIIQADHRLQPPIRD